MIVFDFILNLIFPNTCPFCGTVIGFREHCCEKCQASVDINTPYYIENSKENIINFALSPFPYTNEFLYCVIDLKYNLNIKSAEHIAYYMNLLLVKKDLIPKIDIIVPVPMHRKKKRKRGFNQSDVIGKKLSKLIKKKVVSKALVKIKATKEQHTLSPLGREYNLKGAIVGNKKLIRGKNILLLDDVATTLNTAKTCARILKKNGAKSVIFISACKTQRNNNETPQ